MRPVTLHNLSSCSLIELCDEIQRQAVVCQTGSILDSQLLASNALRVVTHVAEHLKIRMHRVGDTMEFRPCVSCRSVYHVRLDDGRRHCIHCAEDEAASIEEAEARS